MTAQEMKREQNLLGIVAISDSMAFLTGGFQKVNAACDAGYQLGREIASRGRATHKDTVAMLAIVDRINQGWNHGGLTITVWSELHWRGPKQPVCQRALEWLSALTATSPL